MPPNNSSVPWDIMASAYVIARREGSSWTGFEPIAASWPAERFGARSNGTIRQHYSRLRRHGGNGRWAEQEQKAREVFAWNPPRLNWSGSAMDWYVWCIDNKVPGLVRPS